MRNLITAGFLLTLATSSMSATGPAIPDSDAIRVAEDEWSQAFVSGDVETLNDLLDPCYVSVSATGAPRDKGQVMDMARMYAAKNPGQVADPLSSSAIVQIQGDTAIVRHQSAKEVSVDVFYRLEGRWHALYSQHTALSR